jgi:DNA-binding beta-propeller fold protein YncE
MALGKWVEKLIFPRFVQRALKILHSNNRSFFVLLFALTIIFGIVGYWRMKLHPGTLVAPLTTQTVRPIQPHYLFIIDGKTKATDAIKSAKTLTGPLAVSVSSDRVFVADTGHSQVQVYSRDGTWISAWGQGKLNYPFALTFSNNRLYVADPNLMKLFIYDDKGNEQKPLLDKQKLQLTSGKQGETIRPTAVQVGVDNLIYVADVGNQVVLVLDTSGKILR